MINLRTYKQLINVGWIDHLIRILIGLTLMGLASEGLIGSWGWFGIIPFITGAFRYCPAYSLLGINTCKGLKNAK